MPASSVPRAVPATLDGQMLQAQLDAHGASSVHPSPYMGPEDHGFLGWSIDPQLGASTLTLTAGTIYVAAVKMAATSAVSNVIVPLSGGGAGTTASFVAVWTTAGVRLGVSADQTTGWATGGTKTVALTAATPTLGIGTIIWVGILAVGGTPVIRAASNAATVNQAYQRYSSLAGQTTMINPLTGQSNATQPIVLFIS